LKQRPVGLRDVSEYGVVLGSVSKAWGAPGLRVGWALGDARWLAPAGLVHAYMVTAPARPSQRAALALLRESTMVLAAARNELSMRWAAYSLAFLQSFGYLPTPTSGGFYQWLELPESAKADPMAFCLRLRDEGGVVVVPGFAFGEGGRGHVRLSFGGMPTDIAEGVRRLAPFWRNL
ncbi:MAG: aminotransferase class I/II-fold pyridoxal phosphate-dependent enzyme, partial [Holophaga sp.]|nr:aminotransferase class I/II-fold pyridoxal phosphate-dependent enzyme [Holophaga sp.]